jgi:hypothetical protein
LKRVFSSREIGDAYDVVDYLGQKGITARIFNEHSSTTPGMPGQFSGLVNAEVWVEDDSTFDDARELIEKYESRRLLRTETRMQDSGWNCRSCGEVNPASFELCWKCGGTPDSSAT